MHRKTLSKLLRQGLQIVVTGGLLLGWRARAEVLDRNYSDADFFGGAFLVGQASGFIFAHGTKFTVAGNGFFDLTRLTIFAQNVDGSADANHYEVSIVADEYNRHNGTHQPSDTPVWSGSPSGIGSIEMNYSMNLSGVVEGGQDYWILFSPIAEDSGYYTWSFPGSAFGSIQDPGMVAFRWSLTGVPSGDWAAGGNTYRPSFIVEGIAVPEPETLALLLIGAATAAARLRLAARACVTPATNRCS